MSPKPLKLAEVILLVAVVVGGGWWLAREPAQVTQPSPTPTASIPSPREGIVCENSISWVKNGEVIDVVETTRFGFCLNIAKYPFENTKIICSKNAGIGYVSNWFLNGPDDYPIGYQASGNGTCTWQNGDFKATINIRNN